MKRSRLVGLIFAALCVCGVVFASVSSAAVLLLENLPEVANRAYTSASVGVSKLETLNGNSIECGRATDTSKEVTNKPPLGTYTIDFTECKSEKPIKGLKCNTAGDPEGTILVAGEWHLLFDINPATNLTGLAIVFLQNEIEIICGGGLTRVKVRGSLICLHLEATVKKRTHEFHCKNNGTTGDPQETQFWDNEGNVHTASLLSSFNGGAFESSAETALATVTSTEEVFADA